MGAEGDADAAAMDRMADAMDCKVGTRGSEGGRTLEELYEENCGPWFWGTEIREQGWGLEKNCSWASIRAT